MNSYLNFKRHFNQEYIYTYLQLLSKIEEYKEKKEKERILLLKLPEPNFTRVLQGIKMSKVCNVFTDGWTSFDEIIDGVHIRVKCVGKRLNSEGLLKLMKGENAI